MKTSELYLRITSVTIRNENNTDFDVILYRTKYYHAGLLDAVLRNENLSRVLCNILQLNAQNNE